MENNINEIGWTIKTTRNESSGKLIIMEYLEIVEL